MGLSRTWNINHPSSQYLPGVAGQTLVRRSKKLSTSCDLWRLSSSGLGIILSSSFRTSTALCVFGKAQSRLFSRSSITYNFERYLS